LLSGSFESALVSFLAGIKNRIGYPHDHRGFLLTKKVVEKERRHYVDYILHILEYQNLKVEDRKTEIYVNDVETKYDYIFNKKSKIIGLNLTAVGEEARNWPKEYAVELTKRLLEKNFIVTLFGVKNDLEYGNYLESRIKNNNFVNLIGKTNLVEFVNLVKKCDLYLSVATGGIHIASALGVKVIGLYCPGDDFSWGPVRNNSMVITKSVNCKPCNQHKMKYCKDNKCMKQISVDEVYEKILSFVD
jgi:lipopolysaccharide heptosyltransferase II